MTAHGSWRLAATALLIVLALWSAPAPAGAGPSAPPSVVAQAALYKAADRQAVLEAGARRERASTLPQS